MQFLFIRGVFGAGKGCFHLVEQASQVVFLMKGYLLFG